MESHTNFYHGKHFGFRAFVDDLLHLWKGISVRVKDSYFVRATLLCFVSDIPATRKVCGFPGFKAKLRCSKCLKVFPCEGFGEPTDFSGFDRQSWVARTMKNHMESLEEIEAANTQTEKVRLQKKYGTQYSELCRLPYFDIIRNHVIDPMHNMYLGTAKHMIKVWKESGLLRQEHLPVIQQKLDEMNVPYGVGRIPYKVCSNFIGLTANQWLNWTNLYHFMHSMAFYLHAILIVGHYLLVIICGSFCSTTVHNFGKRH